MPEGFAPHFMATGIGSLPHQDPGQAVSEVLARLPDMPYWPQLPNRDPLEDMNLQYARALEPLLAPQVEGRTVLAFPGGSREEALAGFYQRLMEEPTSAFDLGPKQAAGYFRFLEAVGRAPRSAYPWVKGHVTGPLTLAASVMGPQGKSLLYDEEVAMALAQGLGAQAAAQAERLSGLGRGVMIFFDEPFLSGYGSAFTPVTRQTVVGLLAAAFDEARRRSTPVPVIGVHCCGNTDWSLLVEAGADVLNLDSHGYGENLLLYPQDMARLLERGGAIAWGAVPTSRYQGDETAEGLWQGLKGLLAGLEEKGLPRDALARQALVTPACGMGSLQPKEALAILELTARVSQLARQEY